MAKYDLVGVDGNAFSIMGYTSRALRNEGLRELEEEMTKKAMSGDYWHLIRVRDEYVQMANKKADENGWEGEEE